MKKILKWTGLVILAIMTGIAIVTATSQHKKYAAPYPEIKACKDVAVIARGRHLVFDIAHCAGCHSKVNADSLLQLGMDVPLSGGKVFTLPVGNIYTKNITPDKETGIGNYTDAEIARALRYGVHPDGTAIFNFMPFHNISNEDMTAIISFLRAQKPVRNEVPKHHLNSIGKVINAFLVKPVGPSEEIAERVTADSSTTYGGYIVNNLANCGGCHTKHDIKGTVTGEVLAGGNPVKRKGSTPLTPPNLTPDSTGRIFGWTEEMFISRFRMGKLIEHSEMPWTTFKRMNNTELKAIYRYLKTVKPVKTSKAES